ncbi:MAG: DUF4249 family protein [Melioribacteraceae bacterium]|nr:DUF4249 family protein [Melioribacteraceae bacterium]
MKKSILAASLILMLTSISCDDSFEPKAGFSEKYILNCIINGDSTTQYATISSSFDVDGYDPYTNQNDPFLKTAFVTLTYKNKVYPMRDTLVSRLGDSRYPGPMPVYYLPNFTPNDGTEITVRAVLGNGKILTSSTRSLNPNNFYFSSSTRDIPTGNAYGGTLVFTWKEFFPDQSLNQEIFFAPDLILVYYKIENGIQKRKQIEFPMYLLSQQGKEVGIYPPIANRISTIGYEVPAIDSIMRSISTGDPNKSNYIIDKAYFHLLIMDKNLATYYSAQQTFFDEFSVRINQPDFTNVDGGLGVFGVYITKKVIVNIEKFYIESFGYVKK